MLESRFEDREGGGCYFTANGHEALLVRDKPFEDGAEPSGNSVQAMNLERLHSLTSDDRYRRRAVKAYQAFAGTLRRIPGAASELLMAVAFHHADPREIVIATSGGSGEAEPFLARLRATYNPHHVLLLAPSDRLDALARAVPPAAGKRPLRGQPTAYVCVRGLCERPTTDPAVFAGQIAPPGAKGRQ